MKSDLFSPLKIRELVLKNRIVVSPMCQYSAIEGVPQHWHLVHLGSRAVGGASLILSEATAVSAEGRISLGDTGLWNEEQVQAFLPITNFIKEQSCVPGVQIAHAGRKASTRRPWEAAPSVISEKEGGWTPLAPSSRAFDQHSVLPHEMTVQDIEMVLLQFKVATQNALKAGFQVIEIHMAHGYLLNEFLSPLTNFRQDEYGGSLAHRMRFPLQVATEIRRIWPLEWPVFVRLSAVDWVEGGWTLEDSVVLVEELKKIGIDLIDCSSGGIVAQANIPVKLGYQVPFSEEVRRRTQMMTGAVGLIVDPLQAEEILKQKQADLVFLGREFLRDPYWPLHAAKVLGEDLHWPQQYARAKR